MRFALPIIALLFTTTFAQAILADNFNSYMDQAAFTAAWRPWSANGSSMTLTSGGGLNGSGAVQGAAAANNQMRNARNLESFSDYVGTETAPVKFEFWLFDSDPTSTAGVGARNFNELRAYAGDGVPAYGTGSLQGIIAMGLYNSPVSSRNFHARIYYGGVNAWFNLNTPRSAGWHKMTSLIGDSSIKFYIDDAFDSSVALADAAKVYTFDGVVLGSGLTSAGYSVPFDDLSVSKIEPVLAQTPEPMTVIMLGTGAIILRQRRRSGQPV